MMFERPLIRIATSADAEQLGALAARTFRDTFADDNSTDNMDAYVRDSFSLDRVRDELADEANTFLLAFVEGKGYRAATPSSAQGRPTRASPDATPSNFTGSTSTEVPLEAGWGPLSCGRASTRPDCRVIERFGSVFGNATRERSRSMNSGNSRRSENTSSG